MKKCLCLLLSLTMLCLCAGAALAETVALKVWGSQEDQELLAELCEAFAAEHPETTYEFTYGVVGEADAKARYLEDPAAAADVFSYPDDQIIDLVNADALYEVTRNHDAIVAANSVGSVNAASVGGVLYGYPMTADNGYFLYYDRSVVSDEDAGSFDTLLAAAEKAGKKVQIDISNGWYLAGFFLGNGCTLTLDENGNQICDFNSEKGLQAAEAIRRSKRIFICAHDISHVLSEFLAARLKLLYFDPQIIDLSSLNDTQEKLEAMTPEDLVIFIAFPKYYYPLGSIAKNAVSRGAQLLTITDSISSPTVQYSKYLLVCHTSTRVFYNSLTLPMAMANLLLSYLVIDLGPDYRSRDLTNAVQEQILREQDSADSTEK